MKIYKTVKTETKELVNITCDKCKLESKKHGALPAGVNPYIDTISVYWGFGSRHDMDLWEMCLCEKCTEEMFNNLQNVYKNGIGE